MRGRSEAASGMCPWCLQSAQHSLYGLGTVRMRVSVLRTDVDQLYIMRANVCRVRSALCCSQMSPHDAVPLSKAERNPINRSSNTAHPPHMRMPQRRQRVRRRFPC